MIIFRKIQDIDELTLPVRRFSLAVIVKIKV